jgi:hypothetical protein
MKFFFFLEEEGAPCANLILVLRPTPAVGGCGSGIAARVQKNEWSGESV